MNTPGQQNVPLQQDRSTALLPRIAFEDSAQIDAAESLRGIREPFSTVRRASACAHAQRCGSGSRREAVSVSRVRGISVWLTIRTPARVQDAEGGGSGSRDCSNGMATASRSSRLRSIESRLRLGAFAAKLAATEARAVRPTIRIAIGGGLVDDPDALSAVVHARAGALRRSPGGLGCRRRRRASCAGSCRSRRGAGSCGSIRRRRTRSNAAASDGPAAAGPRHRCVRACVARERSGRENFNGSSRSLPLLNSEITLLDPAATLLRLSIGGRDVTATHQFRMLFDERTFATYLAVLGRRGARAAACRR